VFYEHLLEDENAAYHSLPDRIRHLLKHKKTMHENFITFQKEVCSDQNMDVVPALGESAPLTHNPVALSQVPIINEDFIRDTKLFPTGKLDKDGQQIDLREKTSWTLKLEEVSTCELLEVNLINSISPFIIIRNLKEIMIKDPKRDKFIINVSSMEGAFYRFKQTAHPHTNMAKAAINMITRTSASDYARDRIWMNSVDTGWITDMNPVPKQINNAQQNGVPFQTPLDEIDGAMRILDPIFVRLTKGTISFGKFFKDYESGLW